MISYMIQGCDISVIAYGQKGSGKTYTILGPGLHCAFSETEYGIIPRATREIFYKLMHQTARKFRVKITFIEVYEETVRDLLNTSNFKEELITLEDKHGSLFISGLEEIECQTVSEVFNWLHIGMNNKQVSWEVALHISHSLLMSSNSTKPRSGDSVNSFGGTANTLVVCCVSPASLDFDETMKTLHFSIRVRNIINVLTMNQYNNEAVAREQPQKQQTTDDPNIFQEPNMDTFGLEFAASQWLKLASNAGELLTKLSNKENLSNEEREEIEHWLCLKQECEEVLGSENDIFLDTILCGKCLMEYVTKDINENALTIQKSELSANNGKAMAVLISSLENEKALNV
uniref:Kinesin motor domain-containing protein n=1 Tax=Timema poppense TaxID=170557 RepID=A0A7R9D5I2_TIMPO|nr:unnamed protein product [Timema poppensis]